MPGWASYFNEDDNGSNLAPAGHVMKILSEHTCGGYLEGYILKQLPRPDQPSILLSLIVVFFPCNQLVR
jgi:hypothetical protein